TTLEMKRNPQDLEKIAHLTLEHYNQYADEFWQGTRDHDVSQNIAALLQYIRNEPPFKILDFGCGPGRALKTNGQVRLRVTQDALGSTGCADFFRSMQAIKEAAQGCVPAASGWHGSRAIAALPLARLSRSWALRSAPFALTGAHVGQSGLTDPGERSSRLVLLRPACGSQTDHRSGSGIRASNICLGTRLGSSANTGCRERDGPFARVELGWR